MPKQLASWVENENVVVGEELASTRGQACVWRATERRLFVDFTDLNALDRRIEAASVEGSRLRELATTNPPPASWYDENDDPFAP